MDFRISKTKKTEKQIHIPCFGLLYNKSLDIITHSKCMHNKLSPTSDHCHSRAKEGVRAQLDRVRNSEVHIWRLEFTVALQDFYFCTIFCLNTLLFYFKSLESNLNLPMVMKKMTEGCDYTWSLSNRTFISPSIIINMKTFRRTFR